MPDLNELDECPTCEVRMVYCATIHEEWLECERCGYSMLLEEDIDLINDEEWLYGQR